MAIFGRAQPHQPIILGLERYAPAVPPVARQVLVMRAPFAPRPALPHQVVTGLIRTIPVSPPLGKAIVIQDTQAAALFARRPLFKAVQNGRTTFTAAATPVGKALVVQDAQAAALFARRPLFRPVQNHRTTFAALQPPVGKLALYGEGVSQAAAFLARVKHPAPLILTVNFSLAPPPARMLWVIKT